MPLKKVEERRINGVKFFNYKIFNELSLKIEYDWRLCKIDILINENLKLQTFLIEMLE